MTGKDKPALYELVNKGRLSTPGWFYRKKKSTLEDMREHASSPEGVPSEMPLPTDISSPPPPAQSVFQSSPTESWLKLQENKLQFTFSYGWLFIIGLALIFLVVAAYSVGRSQAGESDKERTPKDKKYQESSIGDNVNLDSIKKSTPRPDLLPVKRPAEAKIPGAKINPPKISADTSMADPAALTGSCLIVCGDSNKDNLKILKKYFSEKGFETRIGKHGGRFVLASIDTFENRSEDTYKTLYQKAQEIGKAYINRTPRMAPFYKMKTFDSAFTVNAKDVKPAD